MATFVIGDYKYETIHGSLVQATAVDKTKSSYADIPENVTYGGQTYTVNSLATCFEGCTNLITPPSLPSSVNSMARCFYGCRKMTTPPTIPSSVTSLTNCFYNCQAMTTAPTIPNYVTNMTGCFNNCISIVTPPTIPNGVTNMQTAFANCTKLKTAPTIPASVTNMIQCFLNCTALTGNIVVNNSPTTSNSNQIFVSTANDIYVINGGNAGSVWKNTIASAYSNVHYEADDNPAPSLSFSVTRVDTAVSETPSEAGEYAFIKATAILYDTFLPVGWSIEYDENESITKDGTAQSPYWTRTPVGNTYTLKCWLSLGDTAKHTFTLQVSDSVLNENDVVKATKLSSVITQILAKAYKLVDYYHDTTTDTEGMAVGKFATEANLFDVDMPSLFRDTLSLTDGNAVIRLLFDYVYPVGSYYETSKSPSEFDPNVVWGGTWIQETSGQVHVSAGGAYSVSGALNNQTDGGASTVTLTKEQSGLPAHGHGFTQPKIPNHSHTLANATGVWMNSTGTKNIASGSSAIRTTKTISVNSSGGGGACTGGAVSQNDGAGATSAHNNMQPYIVVYRWHRTA